MKLEQQPPNRPNFLAVLLMAAGAILVIFIIAWVVVRWGGGAKFLKKSETKAPTSQLVMPALPQPAPPLAV
jgi:hypothetical protein